MATFDIHEAEARLPRILDRALAGEEIVIARAGRPVARLVPLESTSVIRVPGKYTGRIRMSRDFSDPLPDIG